MLTPRIRDTIEPVKVAIEFMVFPPYKTFDYAPSISLKPLPLYYETGWFPEILSFKQGERAHLTNIRPADRQVAISLAEAERAANIVLGEGDADTIDISIEALAAEPEPSRYQQSLEANNISGGLTND